MACPLVRVGGQSNASVMKLSVYHAGVRSHRVADVLEFQFQRPPPTLPRTCDNDLRIWKERTMCFHFSNTR